MPPPPPRDQGADQLARHGVVTQHHRRARVRPGDAEAAVRDALAPHLNFVALLWQRKLLPKRRRPRAPRGARTGVVPGGSGDAQRQGGGEEEEDWPSKAHA